ncbi:MAG: histidine kinase [Aquabacterium sp.]|nr:histidine kinase [Aquabacterium sp.]
MNEPRVRSLMHDLKVHEVELEMQNEELRRIQIDLALARDRYVNLYDFSPVGYFTLDGHGAIIEVNLTGSTMMGEVRSNLLGRNFRGFVAAADSMRWQHHFELAGLHDAPQRIELRLNLGDDKSLEGQLDCLMVNSGFGQVLRVTMTDIGVRKQAESQRQAADALIDAGEMERGRLSVELHEDLGQNLSALKMELASLASGPLDTIEQVKRVQAMQLTLDNAVSAIRRIAIDMRPRMLDDLGLHAAIEWLARDLEQRVGVDVTVHLDEQAHASLSQSTTIAIYRMVKDMLTYVVQHGHLTHLDIEMREQDGELVFNLLGSSGWTYVEADKRHDKDKNSAAGSLRERARWLGGQLRLDESVSGVQRLSLTVPTPAVAAS